MYFTRRVRSQIPAPTRLTHCIIEYITLLRVKKRASIWGMRDYWFEQRGRRMQNDFAAKATVLIDTVLKGRADGALIRFVTPIHATESPQDADARLQRFMRESLSQFPRFIPF